MGAQNHSTIEQMMLAIGQQARSASRAMAKASSEQKNRALLNIATAIRRDAAKILAQIQKLPTGYRTVINLFIIEGYSHKEIAELLGISENTSKTQLHKGRHMLQKMLKNNF